ncbi:MAG: flagellin [Bdellovibrionales bacterium]|nr:flagellin [Bdellovibrionales bacterium]
MGLRIGTNVAAIAAARNLEKNSGRLERSYQRLASGNRIVRPGDDAAGYAISEQLRGQERGLLQARRNADNAIGLIQVAEGGLSEQNNIVVRLREIAVQAASDTVGDSEREFLDVEFQQLVQEADRIAQATRFGQKQLLVGTNEEFEFFLGTSGDPKTDVISYRLDTDTRADSLGLSGLAVSDQDEAQTVLENLDESLVTLANARAGFGSIQGRLEIAGNNLDVQRENVMAARSRISDTDVAAESAELAQAQVLQEFGVSVLAQANQNPGRAMKLLL